MMGAKIEMGVLSLLQRESWGHTEGRDLILNWKSRGRTQSDKESFLEEEAVELNFER